jgi:Fructose-1,6-bisphosphatase
MLTLSIIRADTGGFVGHTAVHPAMVEAARAQVADAVGTKLLDGQVATRGDDLSLILTYERGPKDEEIHGFAFDVFRPPPTSPSSSGCTAPARTCCRTRSAATFGGWVRATQSGSSPNGCRNRC